MPATHWMPINAANNRSVCRWMLCSARAKRAVARRAIESAGSLADGISRGQHQIPNSGQPNTLVASRCGCPGVGAGLAAGRPVIEQRDQLAASGVVARVTARTGNAAAEHEGTGRVVEQRLAGCRPHQTAGPLARLSSRTAVTPGIAEASRHVSVCSQPSAKPSGLRKRTYVFGRTRTRASASVNSSRLARVQEHCGCASRTSVGPSADRDSRLAAGHGRERWPPFQACYRNAQARRARRQRQATRQKPVHQSALGGGLSLDDFVFWRNKTVQYTTLGCNRLTRSSLTQGFAPKHLESSHLHWFAGRSRPPIVGLVPCYFETENRRCGD